MDRKRACETLAMHDLGEHAREIANAEKTKAQPGKSGTTTSMAATFGNTSGPSTSEEVLEKEHIKKEKKAKQRATRESLGPSFRPLEPEE
jgi:hypothetical protein